MNAVKHIKVFTAEVRRMVKKLDLNGFKHLEVVLRNRKEEEGGGYMLTATFYKGNDVRSMMYLIDDKKVAMKLFDLAEKITRKYSEE